MKKIILILIVMFAVTSVPASAQVFKKSAPRSVFEQKIYDICKEVASSMDKKDSTKIAISEFYTLEGPRSPYSRFLNEAVTIELFKTKKFKILEKGRLEKVLVEQKMELNGIADGEVAKKVGKILDIKAIMAGTIIEMANTIRVNARLIDTGTGIIVAASTIEIDKKMVMASYPIEMEESFGPAPVINQENQNQFQNNGQAEPQGEAQSQPKNLNTEAGSQNVGKFIVKINDFNGIGNYVRCDVSFTNTGVDEELDFVSAKVEGYATELIFGGKSSPVESIKILGGKTPNYTGKVLIKKGETKIVSFLFQNLLSEQSGIKHLTVLVKGKSFPNSVVIKVI